MTTLVQAISDFINNGPMFWVLLFMFSGVSLRAQATYFIGRYMNHFVLKQGKPKDGWRLNAYNWIHADATQKGVDLVQRRGWPAVTLCFLTVGLQTAVLLGAGVIGMPWLRFTLAMIPGTMAWALIYSTIGWAVWEATVLAALGSPVGVAALVALIALIAVGVVYRRKKRVQLAGESPREPVALDSNFTDVPATGIGLSAPIAALPNDDGGQGGGRADLSQARQEHTM